MRRSKIMRNFSAPEKNQCTPDHLKLIWRNNPNVLENEQSKNDCGILKESQSTSESYNFLSAFDSYFSENNQYENGFHVLRKKQNHIGADFFKKEQNKNSVNKVEKKKKRKSKMNNFQNRSSDIIATSTKIFTNINLNVLEKEQSKNVFSLQKKGQSSNESYISVSEYGLNISKNKQNTSGFDVVGKKQSKNGPNIFKTEQSNSGFNEAKKKGKAKSKMNNFQNSSFDNISTSTKPFTNVNVSVLEKEQSKNVFSVLEKGQSTSESYLPVLEYGSSIFKKQNQIRFNALGKKQNKINANISKQEQNKSGFNEVKKKRKRKKSKLNNFQNSSSQPTSTRRFTNVNVPLNIIAGNTLYNPCKRNLSRNEENTQSLAFLSIQILKRSRAHRRILSAKKDRIKTRIREDYWFKRGILQKKRRIVKKMENLKKLRLIEHVLTNRLIPKSLWIPKGTHNCINIMTSKLTKAVLSNNTIQNRQSSKLNIISEKPVIKNSSYGPAFTINFNSINSMIITKRNKRESTKITYMVKIPTLQQLLEQKSHVKSEKKFQKKKLAKENKVLDCDKYQPPIFDSTLKDIILNKFGRKKTTTSSQKKTSGKKRNNRKKKESVNNSMKSEKVKGKQQHNRNLKTVTTASEKSNYKEKASNKNKPKELLWL